VAFTRDNSSTKMGACSTQVLHSFWLGLILLDRMPIPNAPVVYAGQARSAVSATRRRSSRLAPPAAWTAMP
jgi:hypothetical protein